MSKKIKIIFLLSAFYFLLSIYVVSAAEVKFFEFSPDTSSAANFSSASALYQQFKPYNDFISAIDIWLDNEGGSGSASFSLIDSIGASLKSKSITVSKIGKTWGGTKIHVDFGESINVNGSENYKIKMASSLSKLRAYYKNMTELETHNANTYIDSRMGPAYFGTDEQLFYFKFALYENNDNLAPVISNFSLATSSNSVKISFNANEPVDYKAEFVSLDLSDEKTINFSGQYNLCPEGLNFCVIETAIFPDKSYNFSVFIKDEWGNQAQILGFFDASQISIFNDDVNSTSTATSSEEIIYVNPETIPPAISNARISYVSSYSVKASWTTDKASRSRMIVSLDSAGNQIVADVYDNAYELEHTLNSYSGLNPDTQYFATIAAFNPLGNFSAQILEFKTPKIEDSPPPQPPEQPQEENNLDVLISENENNNDESLINISWQAPQNEPSNGYRIDIFNSAHKLVDQIIASSGIHSATLSGLAPGNYTIIVYTDNNGIFEKIAEPEIIKIPGLGQIDYGKKILNLNSYGIYIIVGLIVIAIGLIILLIYRKKSVTAVAGFTLIETIVGIALLVIVGGLISLFAFHLSDYQLFFTKKFEAQQEIQQTIPFIISEIRSMAQSNVGSYPIASAASSSMTFYSNEDEDDLIEQIRYFLDNDILKKGIIKPSGNPLSYSTSSETISEAIHNMLATSTPIFSYYDQNYTGSQPAMSEPIIASDVRIVETQLAVQDDSSKAPIIIKIQAMPRNLKSNF